MDFGVIGPARKTLLHQFTVTGDIVHQGRDFVRDRRDRFPLYPPRTGPTSIGGVITVPFNSLYHATKWALEGWSESMAFELSQLGIGMKIVEPGGMRTDFFTRSLDVGRHPAYDALVDKVMGAITDPKQMETYSTPETIAEVVYEAATDGKDLGDEAFRKAIGQQFFG